MKKYVLNDRIRAKDVRLIDEEGKQVGIVSLVSAIENATQKGLDLLLVSDVSKPPVCKIIDYGQFKYEQQKKDKQAKKGAKSQVLKELKMRPKISEHDYQVRVNKGIEFLEKRYKIKLTIAFKGREFVHPELGHALIQRYTESIKEFGTPNTDIANNSSRAIVVTFSPK